jgi:hypothetical protein
VRVVTPIGFVGGALVGVTVVFSSAAARSGSGTRGAVETAASSDKKVRRFITGSMAGPVADGKRGAARRLAAGEVP